MRLLGLTFLARLAPLARPLLRAGIAAVVLLHAWRALAGASGGELAAWLQAEGAPAPATLADAAGILQIASGVALVLGLFTRLAALVVVLSGSLALLGAPALPGGDLEVALVAGALALALLGPGAASLDHALGIDRADEDRRPFKKAEGRAFTSPAAARRVTRRNR